MFNNIIYFIVVLLVFNINYPGNTPANSLPLTIIMLFLSWLVFAGYCRWGFGALQKRFHNGITDDGGVTGQYQRLTVRLSVLAIFLFALVTYLLNLKYWLQLIPGFQRFSVLQGILALSLFMFYLSTIWYFAYPAYKAIFKPGITRESFVRSNIKFNLPILFPWIVLSLVYDLIALSPWAWPGSFLNTTGGQIIFFAMFLTLLMIFLPGFIRYFWGCTPLKASEKGRELKAFLHEKGFKYRDLLNWPIFEGRMMTAGIMGIVSRYRYILVTDSLLEVLSLEELKGVLAHEMGHAKYRHLYFYILFFVGFMVISFGLSDVFLYLIYAHPLFINMISDTDSKTISLFYLILSVPMLLTLFVYFRYIMGFFMRNFERQADLYSAMTMGTPMPAISSLERIALLSGKIRDLPSWHHFSIRERVDTLWRAIKDPGLIKRHNRFVAVSFLVYLICIGGLGYSLNFGPIKRHLNYSFLEKALKQEILKKPGNVALYQALAMIYHQKEKYKNAIETYERIISLDPDQPESLNNLAWLLVTAPDEELRDKKRSLILAKKAVLLERSSVFLDTLAEAYYANGFIPEAIKTIEEAIAVAKENRGYYEKQLKKFSASGN
ncbi:MAG: M48 family metalloprotease [Deltaproteobacteria bacterium]|nr:M48 family metalloprotease [Deltaproteobacteria bacterium]